MDDEFEALLREMSGLIQVGPATNGSGVPLRAPPRTGGFGGAFRSARAADGVGDSIPPNPPTNGVATSAPGAPKTPDAESPWMNAKDAARYLALPSVKALYQAVRRGHVPAHFIGRSLRIDRREADQFLRARTGPKFRR